MKTLAHALFIFVFLLSNPVWACEEPPCIGIENPYAYATTSVQKNGAIFMVINAEGAAGDNKIVGASADVSETIELHTHIMDGDMMMMRKVEAYDIPVGETVTLEPMGHHIMLMGLKAPLKDGESFPLTLELEEYGSLQVDVMIKNPGDME